MNTKTESTVLKREIPRHWEGNGFFNAAIERLLQIYAKMQQDCENAPPMEKLHILDIGGGAENNEDILFAADEASFRTAAEAQGMPLEVLVSGYEPWLLRAAWALGMGDKGSRLNLEIQAQSEEDKSRFRQLTMDFAKTLFDGDLEQVLHRHKVLPKSGFHIISCHNVFRGDPLDSSPTMLKTATGVAVPEEDVARKALDAAKTGLFKLLDLRRTGKGIKNACNILAFDPFLGSEFGAYMENATA